MPTQIKLVGNHRGKEVILGMNLDDTEIPYSAIEEIIPEIALSQYDYSDIDSGGQTFTVVVTSNVSWEIVDSYDWFACDPEYGEPGDTTVTVTVDANTTEDARAGVIVVIEREVEAAILNLDQ
jgi:hypothetical protein